MNAVQVVEQFFDAFSTGNQEQLLAAFATEVKIRAVRAGTDGAGLYGEYQGLSGLKEMLGKLGALFATESFQVERVLGDQSHAVAEGHFVHRVRATGRPFSSAWALSCTVAGNKITEYRFYEDSAAYEKAAMPA